MVLLGKNLLALSGAVCNIVSGLCIFYKKIQLASSLRLLSSNQKILETCLEQSLRVGFCKVAKCDSRWKFF